MSTTLLDQLAAFVKETSAADIPADVKEKAKIRIINLFAAVGLGMRSGVENPLLTVTRIPSQPEATILFSGVPAPAPHAAACNSYIATSSGTEDGSRFAGAHPSSGIVPSALAAAETLGASGDDFLTAVILAYEVHLRIGYALYPYDLHRGFHSSAILAPLGSAAAVGKLLGLDKIALRNALALACLSSAGLVCAFDAYPSKCYQIARAVKGGYEAALLAKDGMPGPELALEDGFLKAYGNVETIDLTGLGSRFLVTETYLKIHGGCRHIHPAIDAALSLKNDEGVRPEDVEAISVGITSAAHAMEREEPKTYTDARFNTPFLIAVALKEGEVSDEQITDELLADRSLQALCAKTTVAVDAALDKNFPAERGAWVEIKLKNGKTVSRQLQNPVGEPENPLAPEVVGNMFKKALAGILAPDGVDFLYGFLQNLEKQKSLQPFFETVTKK
ncbi:MAG: MmgE/PrpD family protein [Deltaproteobacteria bacterium]|nr:MmgE/PrpD family protein [Deltaproteobacteria bacterium]